MSSCNNKLKYLFKHYSGNLTLFIAFIILFILFSFLIPHFSTIKNLSDITNYSVILGICATGMSVVLLIGEIDLSMGSSVSLCSIISVLVLNESGSLLLAILITIFVGALLGVLNGFFVSIIKLNSFFTTMATMGTFTGLANLLVDGRARSSIYPNLTNMINRRIGVISTPVLIMILIFFLMHFFINKTVFGRKICSVGSSRSACFYSGIKTDTLVFSVFIINGIIAAIAGILLTAQTGTGFPEYSKNLVLNIVAVVLLGGARTSGGKISLFSTFISVLFLSMIENGFLLLNFSSYVQSTLTGIILLLALLSDKIRLVKTNKE